jgi:hypothetical protein
METMSIRLQPALEAKLRQHADAEGLTVEQYFEGLLRSAELTEQEFEHLAMDGLNSGDSIAIDSSYWAEKHRQLDQKLKKTGTR